VDVDGDDEDDVDCKHICLLWFFLLLNVLLLQLVDTALSTLAVIEASVPPPPPRISKGI
jgi:hypothetical protein